MTRLKKHARDKLALISGRKSMTEDTAFLVRHIRFKVRRTTVSVYYPPTVE